MGVGVKPPLFWLNECNQAEVVPKTFFKKVRFLAAKVIVMSVFSAWQIFICIGRTKEKGANFFFFLALPKQFDCRFLVHLVFRFVSL